MLRHAKEIGLTSKDCICIVLRYNPMWTCKSAAKLKEVALEWNVACLVAGGASLAVIYSPALRIEQSNG